MRRRDLNHELARTRARLAEIENLLGLRTGPPLAPPADAFPRDVQARMIRQGRVYQGRVWL